MDRRDVSVAGVLALLAAATYIAFAGAALPIQDQHGRIAAALLEGRWWLGEPPPPWLADLVPCGEGRACAVFPPSPAVLAVPLVPFVGEPLGQALVARVLGGASAGVLYLAVRALGAPHLVALAGAVLSAFGTTLFFSSVDARAPYVGHAVAVFFASGALLAAARGGPAWVVGAALGLAALARLPVAAAFPALALLAAHRSGAPYPVALRGVVIGGLPFALAYAAYNVLRWGTPLDLGYARLAEGDVFFRFGLFSPLHLLRHLHAMLLPLPDIVDGVPWFLRPRYAGMSLFVVTPALLWALGGLRAIRRDPALRAVALAAGLALLPDVLYGSTGAPQLGYRYSLDAQPFLVALALAGAARAEGHWRRAPSAAFLAACVAAVTLNVYATVAIVHFRYWQ